MTWLLETLGGAASFVLHAVAELWGAKFGCAVVFFFVVCLIELFARRRARSWTRGTFQSAGASVLVYVVNLILSTVVFAAAKALEAAYEWTNIPHLPTSTWEGKPMWLIAVAAIVSHDFANYWNHRAMHVRWIWPIHAVHHSDPEVTAMTTFRVHALEGLFMRASYVVLLSWLGLPPLTIALVSVVLLLHNQYVHVDVDWTHGPFKWVIASPRFHRWHHANHRDAYGKNLANLFPVFDLLFGTYYDPGPCREPMGTDDVPKNDVVKLMLFPFVHWKSMLTGLLRREDRTRS